MLRGPHVDSFLSNHLESLQREDLDFEILAEKLGDALESLGQKRGAAPAIAEGSKKDASSSDSGAKEGEGAELSELEQAHSALSPAERVVDLLDRLAVASQPLLQRIINASDKDLDQLLAELEADEMATTLGLPSLPRDLVQSPNTLSLDALARRSGMSNTRALMRDRRLRKRKKAEQEKAGVAEMLAQVQEEGEWDVDDEFRAQQEVLKLTKQAEKARAKGEVGQWSQKQKKEMVELLEAAAAAEEGGEKALAEFGGEEEEARLAFDAQRVNGLSQYKGNFVSKDKWFTTTPSVGLTQPTTHPRTHSIPVASLHFRSYFPHLVDLQTHFVLHSAHFLGIPVSKPAHLPTQRTLITVLRGPFVHKKSQENWERKTHKRAIKVWDCDPALLKGWLAYLERHGVEGVGMRITRWEWVSMDHLEGEAKPGEGQLREKDWTEGGDAPSRSSASAGKSQ
jgi:ribosomal protein S10